MKALQKLRDILSRGLRGPASRTELFDTVELVVEQLEDRRLLSGGVTALLVGNLLVIEDADAAVDDNLEIELSPDGESISIFDHDLGQPVQIDIGGFLFNSVDRNDVHKIEVVFHQGTNHLATPLIDQIDLEVTGGSGLDIVELTRDEGAFYSNQVMLHVEQTVISGAGTYNALQTTIGGDLEIADVSVQWIGNTFQVAGTVTINGSLALDGAGNLTLHDVQDGGTGHSELILGGWTSITFDGDVSVDRLTLGDGFSPAIEQVDIYGHVDAHQAYLRVDGLEIHAGGTLSGDDVSITTSTDHDIHLGDVTNGAFLGLSQDELDRIDATILSFGVSGTGKLVVVDDIAYSFGSLSFFSVGDLTVEHDISLGEPGASLTVSSGGELHVTSGAVLSVLDFGGLTLQGNGGVVIDGGAVVSIVDGGLTVYGDLTVTDALLTAIGDGSIEAYGDTIELSSSVPVFVVAGSGIITVAPRTSGRAIDLGGADSATALGITNGELALMSGPVGVGSMSTGDIFVSTPIHSANDLHLTSGQTITVASLIAMASDRSFSALSFGTTADYGIDFNSAGAGVETSGSGSMNIMADRGVRLAPGATLSTADGGIFVMGNSFATSGDEAGVLIDGGLLSTTGVGEIQLIGNGDAAAYGVVLRNGAQVQAHPGATGRVLVTGTVTGASSERSGVLIDGSSLLSSIGEIDITGRGGETGSGARGVEIIDSTIQNSGLERIRVSGTGGGTDSGNDGVFIQDSVIEARGAGELGIYGTAGASASPTGEDTVGIRVTGSGTILSVSGGDMSIFGLGSSGTGAAGGNLGVAILAGGVVQTHGQGNISISGTAGGTTQGNLGVRVSGGVLIQSIGTGLAADKGKVQIYGSGSGDQGNIGVEISGGTNIVTYEGELTVNGTAGSGSLDGNYGVVIDGANITSNGRASITLVGSGGSGGDGPARNDGLRIVNLSSIASTGTGLATNEGKISLIGTSGGGSQGGYGVYINEGVVQSVDGEIFVTGNGSTGPGPNRSGVLVYRGWVETTGSGTLEMSGSEGSGGGFGIEIIAGAAVRTTGTGAGSFGASSISVTIAAPTDFQFAGGVSFSTGTLTFDVVSGTAVLDAAINAGTLVKTGITDIRLQGSGTVGSTIVTQGRLAIDGSLDSLVTVEVDGILTGSGSITGDVDNAGWLEGSLHIVGNVTGTGNFNPGGSLGAGTLTIEGDFTPTGTVLLELFSPGGSDLIAVTGTVDLSGSEIALFQSVTSPSGTTYALITSDGVDATIPFSNLSEGSTIELDGVDFAVTYLAGANGNTFQLTQLEQAVRTLTAVFNPAGNLVITDTAGVDNDITIVQDGAGNLVITDATQMFVAAPTGGMLSNGGRTLTIAASLITDELIIVAGDGNDVLTLDFRNGKLTNSTTFDLIDFQGGLGTDSLVILDTALAPSYQVTHRVIDPSNSLINVQRNEGVWVNFLDARHSGVESIVDDLLAPTRQFVTHGGGANVSLNDGTANDGRMTASISPTFDIDFDISITNILEIDTFDGNNVVTIASVDNGFSAGLEINGGLAGLFDYSTDTVRILADLHLGSALEDGFLIVWAGEIELGGDIDMSTDDGPTGRWVSMNGHITLLADVAIQTAGVTEYGTVMLSGVDGAHRLSINVGEHGDLLLYGAVGGSTPLAGLDVTAGMIQLYSNLIQTDAGSVVLDARVVLTADPLLYPTFMIDTESGQDSAAGSVTITGQVSSGNPALNLTIDTTTGTGLQAGAVSFGGADDYATNILMADLTILAGGSGLLAGDVQLAGGVAISGNLDVQGRTITLASGVGITLTGASSVSFDATRNIILAANSSITGVDGDITLRANQGGARTSGSFSGITLTQATIETSGLGDILLEGRAGDGATGNFHRGVVIDSGSAVRSTTNSADPDDGSITIVGEGAQGTGSLYIGVDLLNFGQVQSTGSAGVSITGIGGSGAQNFGVRLQNLGGVSASGTGPVSLTGTTVLLAGGAEFSHSGAATIETDAGLTIQRSLTLAASVTGTGGLSVASSMIVTMTGVSDYTGATAVSGILFVDGSIASDVTISSGAILGGIGTVSGNVTLAGGTLRDALTINGNVSGSGTYSPGAFFGIGTLTINGNFTPTGTVEMQADNSFGGADQIVVNGVVDLSGATLVLDGSIMSSPGQSLTLISNNDNDAVFPFSGLAEGSTVTINGVDFTISYVAGPGNNDVVLTQAGSVATLTAVADGLGNLTITDIDGTGRDNQLTIRRVGDDLVITDLFETFVAAPAGGTISSDGHTITISLASLTGGVFINLAGGADVLTVDYTGGLFTHADFTPVVIDFNGGSGTDTIALIDGSGVRMNSMATYFTSGTGGLIEAAKSGQGVSSLYYSDVASIVDNVAAGARTLWFSSGSETITLADGVANDGRMTATSSLGGTIDFTVDQRQLEVVPDGGTNLVHIASVDAQFRSALIINNPIVGPTATDEILISADLTLGTSTTAGDLRLTADTIRLAGNISIASPFVSNVVLTGAVTLEDDVAITGAVFNVLGTLDGPFHLTVDFSPSVFLQDVGTISALEGLDVTSSLIHLFGNIVVADGDVTLTGDVVIEASDVLIDTTAGTIGGGNVTIDGSVSAFNLAATGTDSGNSLTIRTIHSNQVSGDVLLGGPFDNNFAGQLLHDLSIEAGGPSTESSGDVTFLGDVRIAGNLGAGGNRIRLASGVNVLLTGASSASIGAARSITLETGASIEVVDGDLHLGAERDWSHVPAGDSIGIDLDGATLLSTGAGSIDVRAIGGDDAGGQQYGVALRNGAQIRSMSTDSLTAGSISISGRGVAGPESYGVFISGATTGVSSVAGALSIFGGSDAAIGVLIDDGFVESSASALLSIAASGGGTSDPYGMMLDGTARVRMTGNGNLELSSNGSFHPTASGNAGIVLDGNSLIESTGSGTISIYGLAREGAGAQYGLLMRSAGATIQSTASGGIELSGESEQSSGSNAVGIGILAGSIRALGSGDISLSGLGGASGLGDHGIVIGPDAVVTTASGDISLLGASGTGASASHGIVVDGGFIQAAGAGSISLTGNSFSDGSGNTNFGVAIYGQAVVETTGTSGVAGEGAIEIYGTGGAGTFGGYGVIVQDSGTIVRTAAGDLGLYGLGGGTTGGFHFGVIISSGAVVETRQTGQLILDGKAGGTTDGRGVEVRGTGTVVRTESGLLSIVGEGASGGTGDTFNIGIWIVDNSLVETTAGGAIRINGTAGSGQDTLRGVAHSESARIHAVGGSVEILADAGQGSGTNISGYRQNLGADIILEGSATLSIRGIGSTGTGTSTAADPGAGIDIRGAGTTITSEGGSISLVGLGSSHSGDWNVGILVASGAVITSEGPGQISFDGTGGSGSGAGNVGILLNGSTITSETSGEIVFTGLAGSGNGTGNAGLYVTGATITSEGSGRISFQGTGGSGSGSGNAGIYATTSTITTVSGDLRLTGVGGTGATGTDNHGIALISSSRVASVGGDILLDGTGGGAPSTTGTNSGVAILTSAIVESTGGGDITVEGVGGSGPTSRGVWMQLGGQIVSSGTGAINVTGTGGATGTDGTGVTMQGASTLIASVSGQIEVTGFGGSGGANLNRGVHLFNGATISSTGSASIIVHGTGGAGGSQSYGVYMQAGTAIRSSIAGDVTVTGLGGAGGLEKIGLRVTGGTIESTGTGALSVSGYGGAGTDSNYGVLLDGAAVIRGGGNALHLLYGQGGSGTGTNNIGLSIAGTAQVSMTGSGEFRLTGLGGTGSSDAMGIRVQSSIVGAPAVGSTAAATGLIRMVGTGGTSTSGDNLGASIAAGNAVRALGAGAIFIEGDAGTGGSGNIGIDLLTGSVISTTSGSLTLDGDGGSGAGSDQVGVRLTSAQVTTTGGAIQVTGRGGTGINDNVGVLLTSSSVTTNGAGTIDFAAAGGFSASGLRNDGVRLAGSTISTVNGNLTLGGTGGGISVSSPSGGENVGIRISSGSVTSTTGTGQLRLIGQGGANGGNNHGILITGAGTAVEVQDGLALIEGSGGTGSGFNTGITVSAGGRVESLGLANLTMTGSGSSSSTGDRNEGLALATATVRAAVGNITLNGSGGGSGTAGFYNRGVGIYDASLVEKTGNGLITIDGTGGRGSDGNEGVAIFFGSTVAITGGTTGSIEITGSALATPTGSNNNGVSIGGDYGVWTTAVVSNVTSGGIRLTGTGGGTATGSNNYGLHLQGEVETLGEVRLTGIGGRGASSDGVRIASDQGHGLVRSTGEGEVSVNSRVGATSTGVGLNIEGGTISSLDAGGAGSGTILIQTDSMSVDSTGLIDAGTGFVSIHAHSQIALNLGSTVELTGQLSLSDAELDRVRAGSIELAAGGYFGDNVEITAPITRSDGANLTIYGFGGSISFVGAGSLQIGGDLILTTTYGIFSGSAATDITAANAFLSSDQGIGQAGNALTVQLTGHLATFSGNADQYLANTGPSAIQLTTVTTSAATLHLTGGSFTVRAGEAINNSTFVSIEGATLDIGTGVTEQVAGLTLASGSVVGAGQIRSASDYLLQSGTVSLGLTGTVGAIKSTAGLVTLSGISNYTGQTSINGGTLALNGEITSNVTVGASGILQGNGSIHGNVTGSGTIRPGSGSGAADLGTLSIDGNLTFSGRIEFNLLGAGTAGTDFDQLIVTGIANLSGSNLQFVGETGGTTPTGATIRLIDVRGGGVTLPAASPTEGQSVSINGVFFTIRYGGGDGNDVVLTESVPTGTLTASLVGGVLTITDASGTATDNRWTIILDGATLKITDDTEVFGVNSTPGTLEDGGRTLRIAVTLVTGPVIFDGMGGGDTLTIDVSGGQILQAIEFDGGAGPASDALTLVGSLPSGQAWRSVTYQHVDASSGTITLATDAATTLVTYRGLEPILDDLFVQSRIFRYGSASETITLVAADPAHMTIDSEAAESVTFRAATVLTRIAGGDGDDVIRIISLSANFQGSLTIDGNAGNDRVELNASLVLGSGTTLDVDLSNDAAPGDRDQIVVGPGTAITATGSGLIILKANQSIAFGPGSSLTTENTDARLTVDSTLTANVFGFVGIDLNQATIRTTGTGAVELTASGQIVLGEGTLVLTGGRPVTLTSTGPLADISIRGTINTQGGTITILSDDDADFGAAAIVRTGGGALTISADLNQDGVGGIRMLDGSLLDAGTGRVVITAAGDISVSRVRTTGEMVIVSRLGEIRDSDTNLGLDLEAGRLALAADKGIGRGNPLEIAVGTLAAMTNTGSIELVNQTGQTLEIGTVAGLPGLTNTDTGSGDINILTDGPLVVNAPITSTAQYSAAPNGVEQGIVKIKSENPATETDDVIVNAPIDAPGAKVIIEAGDDVTLNDTGREIDIRGRIVTVAAGPQGQTGTETHRITLSVNTLIESSTGRVNSLTPALSSVTTNRIGGDGRAQVTFDYGNSLERNYTIIVDWGDGTQDVYNVPASGQLTLEHTYTRAVDPNNPSAGIPVKVTVLHDGNVSLYQASVSATGAEEVQFNEVSGTGAQPEIVYVIAVDAPSMPIMRIEAVDTPILQATLPQQMSAEPDASPGVERKLTQDEWVVVAQELDRQGLPVKDAQGRPITRTFGPELTAKLLSKIQSLYNELEEGRFKVYMQAGAGKPLLVIDVLLRNSRPVSDEEDIHERPEATEVEGTPTVTGQEPGGMTSRKSGDEPPPPRPGGGDGAGPAGVREDLSGLDRPARSVLGWIAQRLKSIGLM